MRLICVSYALFERCLCVSYVLPSRYLWRCQLNDDEKLKRAKELLSARPPRKGGRTSACAKHLHQLRDNIEKARSLGFGYKRIADALRSAEIPATTDSIRWFCKTVLGEQTKRRRRSKSADRDNTAQTKSPSAGGRESADKKQVADADRGTTKTIPGAKPGFRVAKDDL